MLVASPRMKELIRRRNRRLRDAERGKLAKARLTALSKRFSAFMMLEWREGRAPTLFTYEGPLIHALRAALVLQGWQWREANDTARSVVDLALNLTGAERPSWNEGQAIEQERFIERTRCVRCRRPLPEERRAFCSDICMNVEHARRHRRMGWNESRADLVLVSERNDDD